jgi:hypothetical protein
MLIRMTLVASDTSIQTALEPVNLFERIGKGGCDIGGQRPIQAVGLYEPGTSQPHSGERLGCKRYGPGCAYSSEGQPLSLMSFKIGFGLASTR